MNMTPNIIPCYCCGKHCFDTGPAWMSTCRQCAIEIENTFSNGGNQGTKAHGHKSDPRDGNGFGRTYLKIMDQLKLKHNTQAPTLASMGGRKVYTDMCPCGIHSSQCDYHR